jgi:hypothetical protein
MNKLKIGHFLLVLAMLPLFFISCNKDEDIKLDFDITVPDNWVYFINAEVGMVYFAARTKAFDDDTIGEWLSVFKQSLGSYDLNLGSYYTGVKTQFMESSKFQSTIGEKDTAINGTDFKRWITRELESIPTRYNDTVDVNRIFTRYFFYEKDNGYYITLAAIDTLYNQNKPIFDNIMSSFQYKY